MNKENAYKLLDSISEKENYDNEDINSLVKLSHHCDAEIRAYVAELLVSAKGKKAESILICLSDDTDELVRVNSCDSLSAFASVDSYNQLLKRVLNEQSPLVIKYAILSLIDIMNCVDVNKKYLKDIFLKFAKTNDTAITAACFEGLYILGYREYLDKIINLTSTGKYYDKCSVINILRDLITEENKECILSALEKMRKTEKSKAVNSLIDKIIMQW